MIHTQQPGKKIVMRPDIIFCFIFVISFSCSDKLPLDKLEGNYSNKLGSVQLTLSADSSFVFSATNGSSIYKEVGTYRAKGDSLIFYEGIPIDDFVEVIFVDGKSDSLKISIDDPTIFGFDKYLKLRVKDTIEVPFEGKEVIINKKELIASIYKNSNENVLINEDLVFVTDLIIQNQHQYISLFNHGPTREVVLKKKSIPPTSVRKVAFKMSYTPSYIVCKNCGGANAIDTLFQNK